MRVYVHACGCHVLCSRYLKDLDGIGPVRVGVLPRFAICQALCKHVQVENGVAFWVLDLGLKQFHDVQESLQRAADVYNCRQNKEGKKTRCLSQSITCFFRILLILKQVKSLWNRV